MKRTLELELDFMTDLSPLELASKVAPLVREAVESVKQSLGAELEFDIFPRAGWARGSFCDGAGVNYSVEGMSRGNGVIFTAIQHGNNSSNRLLV